MAGRRKNTRRRNSRRNGRTLWTPHGPAREESGPARPTKIVRYRVEEGRKGFKLIGIHDDGREFTAGYGYKTRKAAWDAASRRYDDSPRFHKKNTRRKNTRQNASRLQSLGVLHDLRTQYGDGTKAYYQAAKQALLNKEISPGSLVGSGYKSPRRAALKYLDNKIQGATSNRRRNPYGKVIKVDGMPNHYIRKNESVTGETRGWTVFGPGPTPHTLPTLKAAKKWTQTLPKTYGPGHRGVLRGSSYMKKNRRRNTRKANHHLKVGDRAEYIPIPGVFGAITKAHAGDKYDIQWEQTGATQTNITGSKLKKAGKKNRRNTRRKNQRHGLFVI